MTFQPPMEVLFVLIIIYIHRLPGTTPLICGIYHQMQRMTNSWRF
jgi:hypothetical protein